VVLQHPREADNPIGTAWMVERCLGAERVIGVELEDDPRYRAALGDPAAPAILLAPGPSAIDLDAQPPEGPVTLVVVDGTWAQARKLLRMNPSLAALPRYAFRPASPSNYRIRREPAPHCVSTIEATVVALSRLERARGGEPDEMKRALAAFDAMVEQQVRIAAEKAESRHFHAAVARAKKRGPRARRMPLGREDLVVIYGEANAWPRGTEHGPHPELVHVVAERIATGERFEAFVAPERPLSPGFTTHTGIPRDRVLAGEPRERFRERLTEYFRETDRLGVWGFYATELLRREGLALPERIDLRSTAIRFLGKPSGDVMETARALGVAPATPWAIGRTGARHAAASSVALALSK
jgi:DTW domain-containing protein YfiP